ncbi:MAG: bifunctional (p)ppGpp synthetase/guanosine-3',5'-bis(diphosphate) 3'-pyrophosphohydrolase [Rikenellaceae bacterium]|nr:bifunctional (p)ppGpp synthetase/guanosine-3',5'-bis(diphosphate) 3'-pyrophosphohydrolase [Rikenellaceae bacterium]
MIDYTQQIENSIQALFSSISERLSTEDMVRVERAYLLAAEAHSEQKRKTGEPYIIHPIAVARIVAEELELGANPIIAAFLHDVVEDTDYTIEQIGERFGADVARLVAAVTKQKKAKYQHSKQVDNFRQILESVSYDIHALLVKLADRLHNMRTLSSMRSDKQMKIAGETDYFYAPLANRLGLYHVKSELENLSFRYRCPREYLELEALVERDIEQKRPHIEAFIAKMSEILTAKGLQARTEVRYRRPYSIWRKMQANHCDFMHVPGRHYIRIIYPQSEQYSEKEYALKIYAALTDYFKERPGSVSNYINAPKENGYQSFHVKLLREQGFWEEIHISSERMVRNSRLGCAAERTEQNVHKWLEKLKAILRTDVAVNGIQFMEGVTSSFYNDDIMVFTPAGQGIILPKNATALDFAFEIHSDIGRYAHYARINGRLCSVKTQLSRGDCVEIATDRSIDPQPDWLGAVRTFKAKKALHLFFASRPKLEYLRCRHCHPLPGDEVVGFKDEKGDITLHKRGCSTAIRLASEQGDSIVNDLTSFAERDDMLYPVRIRIRGIDRYHLLSDLIFCITEQLHLSMSGISTETVDHIGICTIDFAIHSLSELEEAIASIANIDGVDEVSRIDVE